jgi:pilus assembly protein FimV
MAERLDTLEQIVALKDEQIATLEQALREAREASASHTGPRGPAAGTIGAGHAACAARRVAAPPAVEKSSGGVHTRGCRLIGGFIALLLVGLGVLAFLRRRRNRGAALRQAEAPAAPAADAEADVFKPVSTCKSEALSDVARSAPVAGVTSAAQAPTEDTADDDVDAAPD